MCSCHYPRMLCHIFWSQVEYEIICFISSFDETGDQGVHLRLGVTQNGIHLNLQWSQIQTERNGTLKEAYRNVRIY